MMQKFVPEQTEGTQGDTDEQKTIGGTPVADYEPADLSSPDEMEMQNIFGVTAWLTQALAEADGLMAAQTNASTPPVPVEVSPADQTVLLQITALPPDIRSAMPSDAVRTETAGTIGTGPERPVAASGSAPVQTVVPGALHPSIDLVSTAERTGDRDPTSVSAASIEASKQTAPLQPIGPSPLGPTLPGPDLMQAQQVAAESIVMAGDRKTLRLSAAEGGPQGTIVKPGTFDDAILQAPKGDTQAVPPRSRPGLTAGTNRGTTSTRDMQPISDGASIEAKFGPSLRAERDVAIPVQKNGLSFHREFDVGTPETTPSVEQPASGRDRVDRPIPLPQVQATVAERAAQMMQQAQSDAGPRAQPLGPRTAEIELAPAELGKIRLILQTGERGLHLAVSVERPEMVEVVRRHLDGLHRSLLAEGVTLDGLDIGTGRDRSSGSDYASDSSPKENDSDSVKGADADDPRNPPPVTSGRAQARDGRLDLSF
ncbi:flagellar hook-length control protein FliK [Jannaschia donghaensis]|uniref:Flagellar hook-length control protein FliK n=1 Tax=Jannaschia donghaensis TaxID=420998 RepID=A0A0M6YJS6_9RHOB|nr:flagellar hook-length control protein FliK [Jannaschia donghaensis]CTQ49527.1 Flagellar hook-length control protein FliK [Jannaschia donghaensis]